MAEVEMVTYLVSRITRPVKVTSVLPSLVYANLSVSIIMYCDVVTGNV